MFHSWVNHTVFAVYKNSQTDGCSSFKEHIMYVYVNITSMRSSGKALKAFVNEAMMILACFQLAQS
jgi:hypothetical protein